MNNDSILQNHTVRQRTKRLSTLTITPEIQLLL